MKAIWRNHHQTSSFYLFLVGKRQVVKETASILRSFFKIARPRQHSRLAQSESWWNSLLGGKHVHLESFPSHYFKPSPSTDENTCSRHSKWCTNSPQEVSCPLERKGFYSQTRSNTFSQGEKSRPHDMQFIHLFSKYLRTTLYGPGTVLGFADTMKIRRVSGPSCWVVAVSEASAWALFRNRLGWNTALLRGSLHPSSDQ